MEEKFTVEDLKKIIPRITQGFTDYTGVKPVSIEEGRCVCELEISENHLNPIQSVHGGVIYTMADVAGGIAARSMGTQNVTTMNSSISFLNPGLDCKKLTATAVVIKSGKKTTSVEVDITNESGKLLSKVISTYFNLDANRKTK